MTQTTNESPTEAQMRRPWRKSSYSEPNQCVEAGVLADGTVVVRNSNDHSQGVLSFAPGEMRAFLLGAKAGEFDDLVD